MMNVNSADTMIRIDRGNPDADELSALVAVLSASHREGAVADAVAARRPRRIPYVRAKVARPRPHVGAVMLDLPAASGEQLSSQAVTPFAGGRRHVRRVA
jgi:hypothetical protein